MRYKYTKNLLEPIIVKSLSWSQVCRELGVSVASGTQTHIKKRANDFGIDFSHFTGQGWRKGRTFENKYPIERYLSGELFIGSHKLKLRLIKEGFKKKECEDCFLSEWMNKELPLELDHIDRNPKNNKLSNLRIRCPNCHALKTREDRKNKIIK
jgi:hypothetical protein